MRQKIRKAVAALSRGQLLRVDQTVAFDVNEPPYLPDALGACCTTGGAQDGTFCQCSDNVLGRDCCLQGGIHFPEAACADLTCCEPGPDCFGAFCNNAPGTPALCVEGTRSNPPEGDFVFQGCGTDCSTTICPEPETINRCCKKCGDGFINPDALNGECEAFQGMSLSYCDNQGGDFTENATCKDTPICADECVKAPPTGACCFIAPNTGELTCVDGVEEGVCVDTLEGVFKLNQTCDSSPCIEVSTICCEAPTTVTYEQCGPFIACVINSDCTKSVVDVGDSLQCCAPNTGSIPGETFTDCSCTSSGCQFAKAFADCNLSECEDPNGTGSSEQDCCDAGGGSYEAILDCGVDCPL